MALTLVVTPGAVDANSYATLADAEDYALTLPVANGWSAATDPQKNAALAQATRLMDTLSFNGYMTAPGVQVLAWPRSGVLLQDAYVPNVFGDGFSLTLTPTTIPRQIRDACCQFAILLVSDDWSRGLGPITQDSMKVGSISMGRKSHTAWPASVVAMLKPFLIVMPNSGGRLVRG